MSNDAAAAEQASSSEQIDTRALHCFIACDGCGKSDPAMRCSNCKMTYYCGAVCQRMHWKEHKPDCRSVLSMRNACEGIGATIPDNSEHEAVSTIALNSECGICLEEQMKDPIVLEECKHAFCFACLKEWQNYARKPILYQSHQQPTLASSCPYCRQNIQVNLIEDCTEKARLYAARGNKKSLSAEERKKCYDLALQQIDKILTGDNAERDLATICLKAQILSNQNPAEAVKCYKQILALDEEGVSNTIKMNVLLDRAKVAMDSGKEDEADRLMIEAENFHETNSFMSRIGDLGDPMRLVDIKLMLAEALEATSDWKAALDVYMKIMESLENPDMVQPRQNRMMFAGIARCLFELKEYERAVAAAEAALAMNRHFPGVHKLLALPQRAMGKMQQAVASMSRAVLYEAPWDDLNKQENIALLQKLQQESLHNESPPEMK